MAIHAYILPLGAAPTPARDSFRGRFSAIGTSRGCAPCNRRGRGTIRQAVRRA
jgi:hypothetical protein